MDNQRGRVYDGNEYHLMQPVFCIWVMPNAPKELRNHILVLESRYKDIRNGNSEPASGIPHIICVYVGDPDEAEDALCRFLGTLFFAGLRDERDERLKKQYGIVLDENTKRELDKVSMYSEWMEENEELNERRLEETIKEVTREVTEEVTKEVTEEVTKKMTGKLVDVYVKIVNMLIANQMTLDDAIAAAEIPDEYAD